MVRVSRLKNDAERISGRQVQSLQRSGPHRGDLAGPRGDPMAQSETTAAIFPVAFPLAILVTKKDPAAADRPLPVPLLDDGGRRQV